VGGKKSQLQGYRLKNTHVYVKWVGHDIPSWEPVSNRLVRKLDTIPGIKAFGNQEELTVDKSVEGEEALDAANELKLKRVQ